MTAWAHNFAYLGSVEGVVRIDTDRGRIDVGYEFWPADPQYQSPALINARWADGPDGQPVELTSAEHIQVEMEVLRRHVESPRERAARAQANAEMDAEQARDDREDERC